MDVTERRVRSTHRAKALHVGCVPRTEANLWCTECTLQTRRPGCAESLGDPHQKEVKKKGGQWPPFSCLLAGRLLYAVTLCATGLGQGRVNEQLGAAAKCKYYSLGLHFQRHQGIRTLYELARYQVVYL